MTNATLEKWSWLLIYGGLFAASLGVFLLDRQPPFGWVLVLGGGFAAGVGAVMILVRARRGD